MEALYGITDYAAFCGAILLFLALPGPGTFALLNSTAKGGFKAGAAATLGVILGDQVLLWLAVAGVAAVLASSPWVFRGVQWLGALYLAWVGLRLIFARAGAGATPPMAAGHFLRQAFLITLLNPKAIMFYMAFFPLFIDPTQHRGSLTFVVMAVTIATITAGYCLLLCAFARSITARVRAHRGLAQGLQRAAGLVLIAFGIRLGTS